MATAPENPWIKCKLITGVASVEYIYMKPKTNIAFCGFHQGDIKVITEFEKLFLEALNER
jgi:hypothetical protein